jgi:hypothetical protein
MSSISLAAIQSIAGSVQQPKSYFARFTNGSVSPTNTSSVFPTNFATDINSIPLASFNFTTSGLLFTVPSSGAWLISIQSYGITTSNCYIASYANGGNTNHNNIFFNAGLSQANSIGHCGGTILSKGDVIALQCNGTNGTLLSVFQLSIWQSNSI